MKVTISIKPENDTRDVSTLAGAILRALEKRNHEVKSNISPTTGCVTMSLKIASKEKK